MKTNGIDPSPRHIVLAAVLGGRYRKAETIDRLGLDIAPDVAARFECEVRSRCPDTREGGYVVAFGTVGPTVSIDALSYSRDDPDRIVAQARADAARRHFREIAAVLAVFEVPTRAYAPALRVSLNERLVTVDHAAFPLTPREFEIVSILALSRRPVPTDHLADAIWPDADPWNARSTLKVIAHRLGRRLGTRLIACRHRAWSLRDGTCVDL